MHNKLHVRRDKLLVGSIHYQSAQRGCVLGFGLRTQILIRLIASTKYFVVHL